jgi:hypothetical protein
MDTSTAPTTVSRPEFLSLPTELRQRIIGEVILGGHREAPYGPDDPVLFKAFPTDKASPWPRIFDRYLEWQGRLRWENHSLENPALPLLLTSQQLCDDTKSMLALKFFKSFTRYTLDVISFDGLTFRPTWLSVPWRASRIDELYIRLRVFPRTGEKMNAVPYFSLKPWEVFFTLLEEIARHGLFDDDNGATIDRMVIDFVTVEAPGEFSRQHERDLDYKPEEDFPEWWKYIVGGREDASYLGHPQSAARICCLFMRHIRSRGCIPSFLELCRRVGGLLYCVDGGPQIDVLLDRHLDRYSKRRASRSLSMQRFTNDLMDRRCKLGLKSARMSMCSEDEGSEGLSTEDGGRDADLDFDSLVDEMDS